MITIAVVAKALIAIQFTEHTLPHLLLTVNYIMVVGVLACG